MSRPELRQGALEGAAAVGLIVSVASAWRIAGRSIVSWPVGGVLGVVAALLALHRGVGVPWMVVAGLGLLVLGGLAPMPWRLLALTPGALALAAQVPATLPVWARPLTAGAVLAVAAAGPELDTDHRPGVGPTLMAGAALGAWACVPDVEWAAAVAAAFAVVAAGSFWPPLRLGQALVGPGAGLVLWAAAEGARGRPAALVGAVAGLGLFVVVPLRRSLTGSSRRSHGWGRAVVILAGQMAYVALTSRVAGLQTDPWAAAGLATAFLVAAAVLAGWWHTNAAAERGESAAETGAGPGADREPREGDDTVLADPAPDRVARARRGLAWPPRLRR